MSEGCVVFDLRYAGEHYPGVGRYATGLASALLEAHPHWPWRVLMPRGKSPFDLGFVPAAVRVNAPLPAAGPAQFVLGARLRSLGAALYHSPYFLRPWNAGCPSIVTVHDTIPLEPGALSGTRRAIYRWLVADALKAERVITDTLAARQAIEREFARARPAAASTLAIAVVPPGVQIVMPSAEVPKWDRAMVLAVGINKPHKNLALLIEALALIPQARRPLLVCAGPVDARYPDAISLARRWGIERDVRALGRVPEERLASLYLSATIFATATRAEGFGLPLLEAMALGVPAIASDLAVLREVAGEAAVWAPLDDARAWATAIERLLDDAPRRARLSALGLERSKRFRYSAAAERLAAEYRE
ncbi:MAG: glycosyltransferase family 4 protein, partial [Candidatus Eiseniibacteriota bacterium]